MKKLLSVSPIEAILFIILGGVYVAFQLWWAIAVSQDPAAFLPSMASVNPTTVNNNAILLVAVATTVIYAVLGMALRLKEIKVSLIAQFLIRLGIAMMVFTSVGQIVSVFVPAAKWALPTEGIPVMRTYTIVASVGMFLAGVGGNMAWGSGRRQAFIAETGGRKRK
jgi:hypothetical protein